MAPADNSSGAPAEPAPSVSPKVAPSLAKLAVPERSDADVGEEQAGSKAKRNLDFDVTTSQEPPTPVMASLAHAGKHDEEHAQQHVRASVISQISDIRESVDLCTDSESEETSKARFFAKLEREWHADDDASGEGTTTHALAQDAVGAAVNYSLLSRTDDVVASLNADDENDDTSPPTGGVTKSAVLSALGRPKGPTPAPPGVRPPPGAPPPAPGVGAASSAARPRTGPTRPTSAPSAQHPKQSVSPAKTSKSAARDSGPTSRSTGNVGPAPRGLNALGRGGLAQSATALGQASARLGSSPPRPRTAGSSSGGAAAATGGGAASVHAPAPEPEDLSHEMLAAKFEALQVQHAGVSSPEKAAARELRASQTREAELRRLLDQERSRRSEVEGQLRDARSQAAEQRKFHEREKARMRDENERRVALVSKERAVLSQRLSEVEGESAKGRIRAAGADDVVELRGEELAELKREMLEQETLLKGYQAENEAAAKALKQAQSAAKATAERHLEEIAALHSQHTGREERRMDEGAASRRVHELEEELAHVRRQHASREEEMQSELQASRAARREMEARLNGVDLASISPESANLPADDAADVAALKMEHGNLLTEVAELKKKVAWYAENQALVTESDAKLREQAETIVRLERRCAYFDARMGAEKNRGAARGQQQPVPAGTAKEDAVVKVDDAEAATAPPATPSPPRQTSKTARLVTSARVRELERQVADLTEALRRRHPNSISAMVAAAAPSPEEREEMRRLRADNEELESRLLSAEQEHEKQLRALRQEHLRLKGAWETIRAKSESRPYRVKELEAQVAELRTFYGKKVRTLQDQLRSMTADAAASAVPPTRPQTAPRPSATAAAAQQRARPPCCSTAIQTESNEVLPPAPHYLPSAMLPADDAEVSLRLSALQSAYERQQAALVQEVERSAEERHAHRRELKSTEEEHRDRVAGFEERVKSLQARCEEAARLEARCESAEAIAGSLRDRLHAAERGRADAEATVHRLQDRVDHPTGEVAHLRSKVRELSELSDERGEQLREMSARAREVAKTGGAAPGSAMRRDGSRTARERRMEAELVGNKRELESFRAELDGILAMAGELEKQQHQHRRQQHVVLSAH